MDQNVIKNTADRLNIYDKAVIQKTEEYLRVYQSKAFIKTLNDQAKTVLCFDLAANTLNKEFNKELAVSLSGLKKSDYQKNFNTISSILGLDKTITVSNVCVQLACTVVREDAEKILSNYKNIQRKDLDHPQYVAAAVYLACKAKKLSVDKSKIISISRLKPTQWKKLVNEIEALIVEKKEVQKVKNTIVDENLKGNLEKHNSTSKGDHVEIEDYEVWKKRILDEAYSALNQDEDQMQ